MTAGSGVSGTLDRLAGQRALGHQASGHLARQRAPRHLARQWLRVNRHDSEHRVIRYRIVWLDSGHRVTRHQVIWLDSGHGSGTRIIWINSGHRVNWPNRIVRLDQFIMLTTVEASG
ncbi:unnamed protein product [Staurois parvus]|uniref:Uncharacterized protein n=1 Tax=Staurois parvus TaxID=386267 RepID=A0ABN9F436_9NEOB|nr:unnamed protein product [Staurois parvus]